MLSLVGFGTKKKETADRFDFFGRLFSKPCVAARKMFFEASFFTGTSPRASASHFGSLLAQVLSKLELTPLNKVPDWGAILWLNFGEI